MVIDRKRIRHKQRGHTGARGAHRNQFAVDDHQTANATFLAGRNAALLVQQPGLTAQGLAEQLRALTRERCSALAIRARELACGNAAQDVANACLALIEKTMQKTQKK